MNQTIETVVNDMLVQAKARGLKPMTIEYYTNVCHIIARYINEKEGGTCSRNTLEAFITFYKQRFEAQEICEEYLRFLCRVIRMLVSYVETGTIDFSSRAVNKKYNPSPDKLPVIEAILNEYHLENDPRIEMDTVMRHFFCFVESHGKDTATISDTDFFEFMKSVSESNKGSIGRTWRALRYISEYLQAHNLADLRANLSMLKMKGAPIRMIAPYSQEEILKIVTVIDTEEPIGIRNKAIILLAFETGLRSCDIIKLKLSDIDWKAASLHIRQSKTGTDVILPLNGHVMNAVADYILKIRPECGFSEVFLTSKAPIHPYRSTCSLGAALDKYCSKAGVNKLPLRRFHSLRRSFATEMSAAGVPLPTISQMLGHKSIDEDQPYLSYDQEKNAHCALGFSGIPVKNGLYAVLEGGDTA